MCRLPGSRQPRIVAFMGATAGPMLTAAATVSTQAAKVLMPAACSAVAEPTLNVWLATM